MEAVRARRKAIAALVGSVVVYLVAKVGLDLDDDTVAGLVAVLTAIAVERIPNY